MQKELFFDFVSEEGSGALYRTILEDKRISFQFQYSSSDLETDRMEFTEKNYQHFNEFWNAFIQNKQWFCLHPLYIHPDQRPFIKAALKTVHWEVIEDEKWKDMYQHQWNKVLNGPPAYYKPL